MTLLVKDFHFHNMNNSLILLLFVYKLRCLEKKSKKVRGGGPHVREKLEDVWAGVKGGKVHCPMRDIAPACASQLLSNLQKSNKELEVGAKEQRVGNQGVREP